MENRLDALNCSRYYLAIKHVEGEAIRYKTFPARCNSWDCPECARIKAMQYRERMIPLFESKALYFYTFTFYHNKPPIEVWQEYSKCWNRFRTAATKKFGYFSYVRVLECHSQSPYPHLHIIADKLFPPTWLGPELKSAGFGYQTDSKPVTSQGAASYITKYLTKGWNREDCKTIRKNLHLRIISFGGSACNPAPVGVAWNIIARSFLGDTVVDCVNTDVSWSYGSAAKLTYERLFEGFHEWTYFIKPGGFNAEELAELQDILPRRWNVSMQGL